MAFFHNPGNSLSKFMKCLRKRNDRSPRRIRESILLLCSISTLGLAIPSGCGERSSTPPSPGPSNATDALPQHGDMLRRGILGEPKTVDPQLADDEFSFPIIRDLFEGLTAEGPHGGAIPGVAESWEVDSSGTVYRFKLRKNAKWSNGDPVTASEFVTGIRRAANPRTASGSAGLLTTIRNATEVISGRAPIATLGVSAIGSDTVEIRLEHPAPYILEVLSQPVCAPVHGQVPDENKNQSPSNEGFISDGPYHLVKWTPGAFLDIKRNESYWDHEDVHIDSIRYVFENAESTELKQYLAGDLDLTYTIPMPDFDRMVKEHQSEIQTAPILGTLYLALNTTASPLRDSVELRKALSMTVERDLISRNVTGGVTPAYNFVPNGIRDSASKKYEWAQLSQNDRISQAQALYRKAGYSKDAPLRITLFFNSNDGIRRLMIAIAAGWKESLGIETNLKSSEFRVFLEERKNRKNWDAIRLGWYADYDDPESFLDLFQSTSNQNDAGYNNAEFDRLIHSATLEADVAVRRDLLGKAEEVLLSDYPVIPIYFYSTRRMIKPYVGGATITPTNRTYSKYLFWKRDHDSAG
jgi:oligopeptide transport system substrate-binding protein